MQFSITDAYPIKYEKLIRKRWNVPNVFVKKIYLSIVLVNVNKKDIDVVYFLFVIWLYSMKLGNLKMVQYIIKT